MTINISFSSNPMEHPVYAEVVYNNGNGGKATKEFSGKTLRAVLGRIAQWWAEKEAA